MAFGRRGVVGHWLEDLGLTIGFTSAAVVMAQVFVAAPFYVRAAKGGFARIDTDLEAAAADLGAPPLRVFTTITLPLALPGLVTCVIFTFVAAWNEFAMARALVFGNRSRWPLTLGLSDFTQLYEDEWNYLFAASLIAIIPVVVLFALIERYLIKGLTAGAIK